MCDYYLESYYFHFQIHTEAVTGVVGRAELLSSLAYLLALVCYQKAAVRKSAQRKTRWSYVLATLVFTTVSMLCKEQGITVLAVCVVFELCTLHFFPRSPKPAAGGQLGHAIKRISVLFLGCIVLLLARIRLMGSTLPVFTKFDNPAAASKDLTTKFLTFTYLASLNAWLLLAPCDLLCDWTMNTVPLVQSLLGSVYLNHAGCLPEFL